jgi:hypothetical protein
MQRRMFYSPRAACDQVVKVSSTCRNDHLGFKMVVFSVSDLEVLHLSLVGAGGQVTADLPNDGNLTVTLCVSVL